MDLQLSRVALAGPTLLTRFYEGETSMTRLSLQPLHSRFLGFDRLFGDIDRVLADAQNAISATGFPPFNLYKEKTGYSIEIALAGYKKEDIYIRHDRKNGTLTIGSDGAPADVPEGRELLKGGIAGRAFERFFTVADNIVVKSAEMKDGLLTVQLETIEREEDKPLLISIA